MSPNNPATHPIPAQVVILGAGYVGREVARQALARGDRVLATVRSAERARALRDLAGLQVVQSPTLDAGIARHVDTNTHVVICYPADAATDAIVAPALRHAANLTYVSSTGVYGATSGAIDDHTPVPAPDARAARLLAAEDCWRAAGATVLRCPAIYGPDRGLHVRVLRGEHRIPGDGTRHLSRIHVVDLAALLLAAAKVRGETFVVGDLHPAPHIEVVRYVCETGGLPMPPSAAIDSLHPSLGADRSIDGRRALSALGVVLRFPSYREGMALERLEQTGRDGQDVRHPGPRREQR